MNGLMEMNQQSQPEQAPATPQQPAQEITPEQAQAQFNQSMAIATSLLNDAKRGDGLLKVLAQGDPRKASVKVLLAIISRVKALAKDKGETIHDGVILAMAEKLILQISQLAEAAGIFQLTEQDLDMILSSATEQYIKQGLAAGSMTQENVEAGMQELQSMDGQQAAPQQPASPQQAPPQPRGM